MGDVVSVIVVLLTRLRVSDLHWGTPIDFQKSSSTIAFGGHVDHSYLFDIIMRKWRS